MTLLDGLVDRDLDGRDSRSGRHRDVPLVAYDRTTGVFRYWRSRDPPPLTFEAEMRRGWYRQSHGRVDLHSGTVRRLRLVRTSGLLA